MTECKEEKEAEKTKPALLDVLTLFFGRAQSAQPTNQIISQSFLYNGQKAISVIKSIFKNFLFMKTHLSPQQLSKLTESIINT